MRIFTSSIVLALVLFLSLSSMAQTSAKESFMYPATIAGLGTATNGFGGPWLVDTSAHGAEGKAVLAGNVFSYGDLSYAVPDTGNMVQVTLVNAWGDAQRYKRALAATWPNTAGKHYWVSYLLDVKTVPTTDTYCMVKLYSTDTLLAGKGELLAIGKSAGQAAPVFSCGSGAGPNWGGPAADVSTVPIAVGPVWLVVRIDMSGDTLCRTFMWVSPNPATTPDTNTAVVKRFTAMKNGFNAIALEYGGNVGTTPVQVVFDAIRIGQSFAEMSKITGVQELSNNRPVEFDLSQNYPNPFNPTTQVNYSVSKSSYVTLKVYNLLGQSVTTLFEGVRSVGNYQATFNASNLPSGVYFTRLQAGSVSITKKMLLMK